MRSGYDAAVGFIAGVALTTLFAAHVRDQGRDECDNKLPRTEKCVQVWMPEKAAQKGTP
jgi:hypothetical protein